eukprot:3535522-Lingulodinium_polyedra.AAC.1
MPFQRETGLEVRLDSSGKQWKVCRGKKSCGKWNEVGAKFCCRCGKALAGILVPPPPRAKRPSWGPGQATASPF